MLNYLEIETFQKSISCLESYHSHLNRTFPNYPSFVNFAALLVEEEKQLVERIFRDETRGTLIKIKNSIYQKNNLKFSTMKNF